MDCSPPGSTVHRILQARILEWRVIPFFRRSFQPRDLTWVSYTAGRFFTIWATTEAQGIKIAPVRTAITKTSTNNAGQGVEKIHTHSYSISGNVNWKQPQWGFFNNVKTELPTLGCLPEETRIHKDTWSPKLTAALLFIQAQRGKKPIRPSTRNWWRKMVARDNGILHSQKRRI